MLLTANDSHVRRCSGSLVDPSFKQAWQLQLTTSTTSHLDEEVDFTNVHLLLMMKPLSFIASRIEKITNYYVWSSANLLDSWTLPTISLRRGRFEDVGSRLLPRNKWDSFRDVQWIRV